jgi:formylglycine-generating enzyme required for sulfatase activity
MKPLLLLLLAALILATAPSVQAGSGFAITANVAVDTRSSVATLSSLTLSSGTLSPAFAAGTIAYTASVPNAMNSITVTPTVTDDTATIQVNGTTVASGSASGSIALAVGTNTITTVVAAQDGSTTQTYTVTVTRAPSAIATLSSLTLGSGTLNPIFAAETIAYTASVPNATSSLTVTPTVTDTTATIQVNGTTVASGSASGSIALAVGINTITTVVTAQDGETTQTYTVTVTRAPSAIATLSNLVLSSGTLSPTFAAATIAYTASVPNTTTSLRIRPTVTNATATVKVNGTTVASGTNSGLIALAVGINTITTVVTAQDGTTAKTYTVTVTRAPSAIATLSSLALSSGTLNPLFASATIAYTASVPNATSFLTVTPIVTDATATIKVNGTTVASGSASGLIALAVGTNTITTAVTAQDGTTAKTYTVTVTRISNVSTLSGMVLSTGTLSPTFAAATTSYTAGVPNSTSSLTLTPTVTDATATTLVNGTPVASGTASGLIALAVGTNTITTVVTAQDGVTTKTYTVTVKRATTAESKFSLTWAKPAAITYGTALSVKQLNAKASVPGLFDYIPAAGVKLPAGTQTLNVTFTPTDSAKYAPTQKSVALVVAKSAQSIAFPVPPALRYGDADCLLTASAASGLAVSYVSSNPAVATLVDGNKLKVVGAGSVKITASQPGDGNWKPALAVARTLTIGKKPQAITYPTLTKHTMGDADIAPGASASSGLAVTYASSAPAVATVVAGKIHLVGKGTAVITASQAGNANWAAAPPLKQTLTVAAGSQTITFAPLPNKGVGDVDFSPGATASSGLAVTYTSSNSKVATIVAGKIHVLGDGTSTITAKQPGNASWTAAPEVTQTLQVGGKATPVVTWANPAAISYGVALSATQLNAKANVGGTFVYSSPAGTKLPVGQQSLNVTFTPTDAAKYNSVQKSVSLTVNKVVATVTLAGLSQTYSGQPRTVTATTVPAGLPVDITYGGSPDAPTAVGSYPVVATVNDPNAGGTKSATLLVGKGNQTISFASLPAIHVGDEDVSLTASAASGLAVSFVSSTPKVATLVDGKIHAVAVGSAFITATQGGDSNWNAALPVKQLLSVKAELPPAGFALIPAGNFQMGNSMAADKDISDAPIRTVTVSAFYIGQNMVTKADWDTVRTWGLTHGYADVAAGTGKSTNHPVQTIPWYYIVKWCNARSEMDGLTPCYTVAGLVYRTGESDAVDCNWAANGYRLPTEAEWEKAARGGLSGKRFPWGDTISQSKANYNGDTTTCTYDLGPNGYNSIGFIDDSGFIGGSRPYTSPVGSFPANGYGLYDMAGNLSEWCWDLYGAYAAGAQTDPRGAAAGPYRVFRGGGWYGLAGYCRVAYRSCSDPLDGYEFGFRLVRSSVP